MRPSDNEEACTKLIH